MAAITAKMVADLRTQTGCGMMECKKALTETNGDFDEAVKVLREKGLAVAAKKADRIAAEGVVDILVSDDKKTAAMIEVNAESDFVAKNAVFLDFVQGILKTIIATRPANVEELLTKQYLDTDMNVEAMLKDMIFKIGENMNIRRFVIVDGVVSTYIHGKGSTGVIIKFEADENAYYLIGAGAGEYSIYFARKGYEVSALELADANIAAFKKKLTPEDTIDLVQGNALDLSRYADKSFDIVLLFGPLYHLKNDADKQKCISEAKRVCKDDGKIFFAFISNDFVFLTEFGYDVEYFSNGDYDKETFKLNDFPFVFHTVGAARKLLADGGVNVLHEVASDGASELLAARINEMSDEDYTQYLRYHFYICEKPELLGMTNHLLFVGEKK